MKAIALTRAGQLIHIADTLERHGLSAERVLRDAKLPMWHFCDPDDLVPSRHNYVFMDRAARSAGSSTFGLLVGSEHSFASLSSFGALIESSLTTYHAVDTCCRMMHLHTSVAHFWLAEAGDEVWFCRGQFRGAEVGRRQMEQYILMNMIDLVRMGAGASWRPGKVCLQTHEAPERELREALGDPRIHVGQKITGIAVPHTVLALPLWRCGAARSGEDDSGEARLSQTQPADCFAGALRQLVGTLLKEGHPQIETMAEITGLSVRSLQRRLAEDGVSYSELVDQARFQAASSLLEDCGNRITDVAFEVGYADSAHFARAFKRWAGVTPREFRNHHQMN